MCGLFGLVSAENNGFSNTNMDELLGAMNLNMFRGSDSTGMCFVTKDNDYDWMKAVGSPGDFTRNKSWIAFKQDIYKKAKLVFGHGRSATRGTVTLNNAHPFEAFKGDEK